MDGRTAFGAWLRADRVCRTGTSWTWIPWSPVDNGAAGAHSSDSPKFPPLSSQLAISKAVIARGRPVVPGSAARPALPAPDGQVRNRVFPVAQVKRAAKVHLGAFQTRGLPGA